MGQRFHLLFVRVQKAGARFPGLCNCGASLFGGKPEDAETGKRGGEGGGGYCLHACINPCNMYYTRVV